MGIEFEIKFGAAPEICGQILQDHDLPWQIICMETTYYDTADGRLSERRYTLRQRMENGVAVCTVKTPAQDAGRGEWEVENGSIEAAIPELCKLGAPEDLLCLTQAGVIPVCGARFDRHAAAVCFGNTELELALDQGVLFGGSRQQALCEVEVELKCGSREDAITFARLLAAKYGLQREEKSKFRRALSLKEDDHGA